ncbi:MULTISPECIES: phosphatidate cytidylyltransferase [Paraclostridium]|jgi:phosphatidate cytidylyltransferase|uniref:Phosphatidate cytidylyltransferase n=3 Tax=Paraclostridium TaxID=1849822 RepID=A0A0M3DG56_9FIRM|nr:MULTISPECIES: phosphatidate cytidylyltransferase [Paraclostridium]KGJ50026.1 phosphatidate cytidylyltransferase [Clostridium sp. NCR]MDU7905448.1 phosphatidate cytidylyltransferase [Peptostreptococcaceae bacterium]MDU8037843.1 phosphatidate cytidylyltransferase [Streptococcus sp.]MDV8108949.1 phosphatidate cytidylyltransferase [Bacillus sp. BAU-SS-2023]EQK43509.1 cytidylyltransferase family protein [[Clostridium] bifermentans ATCC 638] [Paraclostridium bifermentans ATCC 638 = DSM 14991]
MVVRIIAALALIPLLLFVIYGGLPLYIAEAIIGIIALDEFYKAFKSKNIQPISILGYLFAVYLSLKHILNLKNEYTYVIVFLLFLVGIIYILSGKKNIIDFSITFIGIFYVPIFLDYIVLTINDFKLGAIYVWLIFIISFMTDTFAYFSGYLFGKHKLIPTISPKKTIEGSIGGILGSTICCVIFGYIFKLDIPHMVLVGSIGSIVAQFGDLFASAIKRYVGIKDYGKLIPGHGGILDRFDSVILVAPFVYYAIYLFI